MFLMSELGDRIKQGRENAGRMSQDALAHEIGVSRAAVAQWESKKDNNTKPSIENLVKIAESLDLNIEWLITGNGAMQKKGGEDLYIPGGAKLVESASPMAPVIEWNQVSDWCGNRLGIKDISNPRMIAFTPSDLNSVGNRCFGLIIPSGDESMRPDFNPGCAAICDPDLVPRHLSMVLVSLEAGQFPVIRQLIEYGKTKLLDTLNSRYPGSEMTKSTIIHATVRASVRAFD